MYIAWKFDVSSQSAESVVMETQNQWLRNAIWIKDSQYPRVAGCHGSKFSQTGLGSRKSGKSHKVLSIKSSDFLVPQPVWVFPPLLLVFPPSHPSPGPPLIPSSPFLSNPFNLVSLTRIYFYFVHWSCWALPRRIEFSDLGWGLFLLKNRWETTRVERKWNLKRC